MIEIAMQQYECMDCFFYGRGPYPNIGDTFDVVLAGLCNRDGRGVVPLIANPDKVEKLQSLGGWRYRGYGAVVAVEPSTLLDCGPVIVNLSDAIRDPDMIGKFVAVDIQRLDGWRTW